MRPMPSDDGYLLDNSHDHAGRRLTALSAIFDPVTARHVDRLGVSAGWTCWEVGAGGTSVVELLADRVAPGGRVLATDIDVSRIDVAGGQIEVRRHDVAADPPPEGPFDLVHARLVLVHVPERGRALRNMVGAVHPGGWVLVEDADPMLQPLACIDATDSESELANRIRTGFRTLMASRGADLAFGRTLPRVLRDAGLVDVEADAYFQVALQACDALEEATIAVIRDRLMSEGIATEDEIDRHLAAVTAGRLDLAQPPMISAWGRRT